MSQLTALKAATTLSEAAALLGIKPALLSFNLYKKVSASKYEKFDIPKRHGGTRQICAPLKDLKLIQQRLSLLLQNCVQEIDKVNGRDDDGKHPDRIAHGFKRQRSIMTNAMEHRARRYVFNIDLHDFFGSINFGRVRGFFLKDANFSLHPKVATVLAQIACYENKLPQGSPCSPVISNLIGHVLDIHLAQLASSTGCTYSRYADDLTFSTNRPKFPSNIAKRSDAGEHKWEPGKDLVRLITRSGFTINPTKTRMQYKDSRQEVTGLVVNRKVNVPKDYRHVVRAMVHRLIRTGSFAFEYKTKTSGGATVDSFPGQNDQLLGMLAFVDQVDLYNKKLHAKSNPTLPGSPKREALYRRFLHFHAFYTATSPIIICEGKTDNVYLLHAIRSLAAQYPELAAKDASGAIKLRIRIFKYVGTSTGRILGMYGGTGDLVNFTRHYAEAVKDRFKAPGGMQPVILLVDNDSGSKEILKVAGKISKKKPLNTDSFMFVISNLYIVPTPLKAGASESKIEDFFDAATLATLVDGKQFDSSNDAETTTHYGKTVFAHKVVRVNADTIDFSLFKAILNNVTAVVAEHAKKHMAPTPTA